MATNPPQEKPPENESRPNPNPTTEYTEILDKLVPIVAAFVDHQGGVCSLSLINQDPQIKQLLEQIPPNHDRKLTKILAGYSDFFALLDGGMLATYLGYETGRVTEDNKVFQLYYPDLQVVAPLRKCPPLNSRNSTLVELLLRSLAAE